MIDMEKNIENRSLEIEYVLIANPQIRRRGETWVIYLSCVYIYLHIYMYVCVNWSSSNVCAAVHLKYTMRPEF